MLKFQAVAEKTTKNFRGLLFSAAPCINYDSILYTAQVMTVLRIV